MKYKPHHLKTKPASSADWVLVGLIGLDSFLMTLVICSTLFVL